MKTLRILLVLSFLMLLFPEANAMTPAQREATLQGDILKKKTLQYQQLIIQGDIHLLHSQYDDFTKTIRQTELKIGRVAGPDNRKKLNETFVKPAKIEKERVIYEISQYRLLNKIEGIIHEGRLASAAAELPVMGRLEKRAIAIKEAGSYKAIPAKINVFLKNRHADVKNLYSNQLHATDPNKPENVFPKLVDLKNSWPKLTEQQKKNLIQKDGWNLAADAKYIGYLPMHLGFLYHQTNDEAYRTIVKEIIPLYQKYYMTDQKLQAPISRDLGWWYRDQFARDNRLIYEAYKYTNLPELLSLVDQQADLWINSVPRFSNQGYKVYPYGISNAGNLIGSAEINPNQNIQVASLFSHLYWEPASKFYKNPLIKEIVMHETEAVLTLQKKNGSLPVRQELPLVEDTNYGGYSANMLYHLAQVWGSKSWMKATNDIGHWLFREYSKERPWNTPEDFPNFRVARYENFNLIARVLPFYSAGISDAAVKDWLRYAEERFPRDGKYMLERWYSYQSVPRTMLNDRLIVQNQLPPQLYAENLSGGKVSIRAIGESLHAVSINIHKLDDNVPPVELYSMKDQSRTILLGKGQYSVVIKAVEANGKITETEVSLPVQNDGHVIIETMMFDQYNRFHQKL
ncbi:hypothetical protein GJU40_02660 [Bacillus lacus]|uniref:SbsC C-terminal domain-containing protein n=1 Tax=Metabacillus lacus TaxID=1983721 RepID=A0A7X2IWJ3_9BACI|nr:hypothetical protein [Metabacillus lacus]MRX71070.1 hypothetical protein [Metabacillus lacus]